jgi:hypothetical protein
LQTWEVIQEDADGLIEFSVQDMLERAKRKRMLEKSGAKVTLIPRYQCDKIGRIFA